MSCQKKSSGINQTFIIEPLSMTGGSPTLSACTALYTNAIQSCSGDTSIYLSNGVITFNGNIYTNNSITASTINASTFYSGGTNLLNIINSGQISGGTFNNLNDTLTLYKGDGSNINITGFTDYYTSGATLIGTTVYFDRTDTLSAYTLDISSALQDTFITGATFNNNQLIITNNNGVIINTVIDTFSGLTINGVLSATTISGGTLYGDGSNLTGISTQDTVVTGGTFNPTTGIATYRNNTGGTFTVTGFSNTTLLSATTISATTYLGLPTDIRVTGGTYSNGTTTFRNNTGGTFSVTGLTTKLNWYAENTALPSVAPVATGARSIALGDNAQALAQDMFVYGNQAGLGATNAINSNFIGDRAGYQAINTQYSNFIGALAGFAANNASQSNFMGQSAGFGATLAYFSNFLGTSAGYLATNANDSNFIGNTAGYEATNANDSNFIGNSAGFQATNANNANFFGRLAGNGASSASNSNFMGQNAGDQATNASNANFFGQNAGLQATNTNNSHFIGVNAGSMASNAPFAIFMGQNAGQNATNANRAQFIGQQTGNGATNANSGNFIGNGAGFGATNAAFSNFIGGTAGNSASGASYCNFIGYKAGQSYTNQNVGSNNIIIGTNITLPSGATNSINIGGVLYGINTNSNPNGNPTTAVATSGRISIGTIVPTKRLHIFGESANDSGLRLERLTSTSPTSTGRPIGVDLSGNVITVVDLAVTGGTFNQSTRIATFTNNTGGTFTVGGFTDVFVTGGTHSAGVSTFRNNTGGTFSVTGFSTTFTGGTVTGPTQFTNGLTANTFSATTYLGLPTDIRLTGGTYAPSTGIATYTNNTGGTFNVSGFFRPTDDIYTSGMTFNSSNYDLTIFGSNGVNYTQNLGTLASDMNVTGGTYNNTTGIATFTNNSGGTFNVSGFLTGFTDTRVTGGTFNNNLLTLTRSDGGTINTIINNFSGLTVNGALSATTYLGLPLDITVTGGTWQPGLFTYTNNTGGTFTVSQNVLLETKLNGQASVVWTGVGFIFDVVYPSYYIQGVLYSGGTQQVTLATADPTNPRLDLFTLNASGVVVLTGIPSMDPILPTTDENLNIILTNILVDAGATTPNIVDRNIYKENIEWTGTTNIASLNFNATALPFQGAKHIECNTFANTQFIRFTDSIINNVTDYSTLSFRVFLKSTFATTAKFTFRFYNGNTPVSSVFTLNSGEFGFVRTNVSGYQLVSIPLTSIIFQNSNFNRIDIVMAGSNATGFRLDNIILQKGLVASGTLQNAITNINTNSGVAISDTSNDTISILGVSGVTTTASGKTITISSLFTPDTQTQYNGLFGGITTGGTYSNGTAVFTNRTGGTFSVTGFSTGTSSTDIFTTGGTYNSGTSTLTLQRNDNLSFAISGISSSRLTPVLIDAYNGTRLAPIDSAMNGFHLNKSINGAIGYSVFNPDDAGNASLANFTAKGSGPLYTNNTGISHFGANYFIPYLRGNGLFYSDKRLFINSINNNDIDFRTGADLATATSKFNISSGGTLSIGVAPVVDDSVTTILGRKTDGTIITINKGNLSDIRVTGGTHSNTVTTFINNTGGTFTVTGFTKPINWYAENAALPSVAPVATGSGSIALGNNAQALAQNMFVYGNQAGVSAANANNSNFIGDRAGLNAPYSRFSNFIGTTAGLDAENAEYSNFIGLLAGANAVNANNSNFIGSNAGNDAINAYRSNFIGLEAGMQATNAYQSNFIGQSAGFGANNASDSNLFGNNTGQNAVNANNSNFFGRNAGSYAENAHNSNFMGRDAGSEAVNASGSNFIGIEAGWQATNASGSNFIGIEAGSLADNANDSNFIGVSAGSEAVNANHSNFIGRLAGWGATNAQYSNFIGVGTGNRATNAEFSTFIGYRAGSVDTGEYPGSNNIIIGTNISLPSGATNSMNLGGVLFGTNTHSDIDVNSSISPQTNGRIGVNILEPTEALDVSGDAVIRGLTAATSVVSNVVLTHVDGKIVPMDVNSIGGSIESISHGALLVKIANSQLEIGKKYLINNYRTTHVIPSVAGGPINYGPTEPLIVTALRTNELDVIAKSINYPKDIIYYNVHSDQNMVPGSTRGYIYRRIDTVNNNDIGLDFRHCKFARFKADLITNTYDETLQYNTGSIAVFTGTTSLGPIGINQLILCVQDGEDKIASASVVQYGDNPNLYLWGNKYWVPIPVYADIYTLPTRNLVLPSGTQQITVSSGDYTLFSMFNSYNSTNNFIKQNNTDIIANSDIVFFSTTYNNVIGTNCMHNSVGYNFNGNIIGDNFKLNIIGDDFNNNVIASNFRWNMIGFDCYNNRFNDGVQDSVFGRYFKKNIIEGVVERMYTCEGFRNNDIVSRYLDNIFFTGNICYDDFNKTITTNRSGNRILQYFDYDNLLVTTTNLNE
jgi:hypothetical protein